MKGFREEVLVVGTKFAILFGVVCILFLTLPMLLMNHFYGLDCYQYTYPENINYCLQQDNLLVLIAWLIPIVVVVASYVIGLLMYLLKM
ncbi:gp32.9 [Bacillus phage SPO1]|uniref:Gp32.9 n=2 Tax=Okubovirus TaxID=1857845 RepID=B6V2K7_BPSP1|nr:gp32.9 [Bacillus phage SPO1]YP_008770089.1 hypothetical protein CampHawk_155 [Bacillus phage CampHawk]ACI91056.1 gp32.9 [Bacillus phage SPO1]AGY47033.1 hypothetical protein CampHawk_155 [Bacillus phage CampHawk]